MIYDLPSGYKIVFIPKNGTSSVKKALNWNYENPPDRQIWHDNLDIPDEDKGQVVGILRDPVERFLSCCSYLNGRVGKHNYHFNVKTYMEFYDKYPSPFMTWHMKKQIEFVQNPDWFAKLYYLSEIGEFFKDHKLGQLQHCNKTSSEEKIEATQEVIDFVHEAYAEDYKLLASIKPQHRVL